MKTKIWIDEANRVNTLLQSLVFTDASGKVVSIDIAFESWRNWTIELKRRGGTIYLVGNGASASIASHFAADLAKNAGLHTEVFSDLSLITAISNDLGYEHVFSEPLKRRGKRGDVLIAISSSGKSPNILRAVKEAKTLKMKCVTLSAMSPDNPLRGKGTLNAYIPADSYGHAETCHAAILHYWMDLVCEKTAKTKILTTNRH
jgi:D-sedoheptulose 7-phosphate isomerase